MSLGMIGYISAVKRQLRDRYGFVPNGGTDSDPTFLNIPDGDYPMKIDGKLDQVRIVGGKIHCCQFDAPKGPR